ncbi:Os07g0466300, partial [Oryza sativa Japonica Group]
SPPPPPPSTRSRRRPRLPPPRPLAPSPRRRSIAVRASPPPNPLRHASNPRIRGRAGAAPGEVHQGAQGGPPAQRRRWEGDARPPRRSRAACSYCLANHGLRILSCLCVNIFFVVCFVLQVVMKGLLAWVKSNLIKERPEMFLKGDSVYDFPFPSHGLCA